MKKCFAAVFILIAYVNTCLAQGSTSQSDSSINNLIHTAGYVASEYGAVPSYIKSGNGKRSLILLPGWGFDASVFNDFVEANKNDYTMYVVTIPGYGKTSAPPMPPAGTSYAELDWSKSFLSGLTKLIEKEKLRKPIIAGHFNQGSQLTLRFAIDHPEKTGGVIILGGPPKLVTVRNGVVREFSLDSMKLLTDIFLAEKWFKSITKKVFDAGNYPPSIYSLDSIQGKKLWDQSAAVPLPVMIRYLCELWTMDVLQEMKKLKSPLLVLRATFNNEMLQSDATNYLRPQFIDLWNRAGSKNLNITIKDVPNAATFVWKDNPEFVRQEIASFLSKIPDTLNK
ncbi:MAG: alpha/beta hydrolase [Ignavibacteriales bacterium]|nr:alpha/beta hydrolase [Ignavibacteriales bacterium]